MASIGVFLSTTMFPVPPEDFSPNRTSDF